MRNAKIAEHCARRKRLIAKVTTLFWPVFTFFTGFSTGEKVVATEVYVTPYPTPMLGGRPFCQQLEVVSVTNLTVPLNI